jgi:hypothetical protein
MVSADLLGRDEVLHALQLDEKRQRSRGHRAGCGPAQIAIAGDTGSTCNFATISGRQGRSLMWLKSGGAIRVDSARQSNAAAVRLVMHSAFALRFNWIA